MELENMDAKLSKNGLKTFIRCLDQFLEEFEASIKCGNFAKKLYFQRKIKFEKIFKLLQKLMQAPYKHFRTVFGKLRVHILRFHENFENLVLFVSQTVIMKFYKLWKSNVTVLVPKRHQKARLIFAQPSRPGDATPSTIVQNVTGSGMLGTQRTLEIS